MLLSSTRNRAEQQVKNRRAAEDSNYNLKAKLKQEFYLGEKANWERRGEKVEQRKYVNNRLRDLREEAQSKIEERRARLSELLDKEHIQYKTEMMSVQETQEQVRQRMMERVKTLKEERERKRAVEVSEKLEKNFTLNADELRKVDQDFKELKAVYERNIQIMEKQKMLEDQYQENMIYAELYKIDIKRKEKQEQEELKHRLKKVEERNKILATQKKELDELKQREKDLNQQEKTMLKDEWVKEEHKIKQQLIEQTNLNNKLNKELNLNNIEQKAYKETVKQKEKDDDREMVKKIVEREEALNKLDQELREKQKKDTRDFLLNYKNRNGEVTAQEAEIERLINEENERQWAKRMEVWKREEDARVKLTYEVYKNREIEIDKKKQIQEEVVKESVKDKELLEKNLKDYEKEIERQKIEENQKNKTHQKSILSQIAEKSLRSKEEIELKAKSEKEERLAELEYQKKIELKKLEGRKMLEELRKQRPF